MKESNGIKIKSYIWICWIFWTSILLLIIYSKRQGMMGVSLLESYIFFILIPQALLGLPEFYRLSNYIHETYPVEVDSMRIPSSGLLPKGALLSFADKNSLNDTMLRQLRNNCKKYDRMMIVVFVSFMFLGGFLL